MTKIKILDIRDRPKFIGPGKRAVDQEWLYETAKGHSGSVVLPKEGITEEKVHEAIRKDIALSEKLLGTEISV